ncbi:Trm112 family protein [Desulfolutivibrio sulfoxidireducens]|uniref:Trm112 family protein n=1 Tax=Desulfolutivibrio sulfoxidireducens TaxID=2773299 RepID=UPI00159E1292|nr:Trm112 family protein [Desulfolutivibrio sulfoxidireducens]QLA17428.1 Trm112 family protein [Desulfolutivibrio sulfoxidireducens]QLA21021.1 Trm112 family protein [Desulfolutivibrio sulfoxidireducens]
MALSPELLRILACPKCKGDLEALEAAPGEVEGLACPACDAVYPVREDIPIMLIDEAVPRDAWMAGKRSAKDAPA